MISLITTMALLILVYSVQKTDPLLAGLLAVIPVKIIGTAMMSHETGGVQHLLEAVKGMLIGQFVWGFMLLFLHL